MRPDILFLYGKFHLFNKTIFNDRLPCPKMEISRSRRTRGMLAYKRKKVSGKWVSHDYTLRVSNVYDLEERVLEDIVIHEMIHLLIQSQGMTDSGPHGQLFRNIMDRINREHGRNVTVTHQSQEGEHDTDRQSRGAAVCITRFADGKVGVTVMSTRRVRTLWEPLKHFHGISCQRWYVTTNPFFNRYPRVRTPRILVITPEEADANITDAIEFEIINGRAEFKQK